MTDDPPIASPIASLCVLASGSAGNASVLLIRTSSGPRLILIDAGLSPRRTRRLLSELDLSLDQLNSIVLTHLDHDHWHSGWLKALPGHVRVCAHHRHAVRGRRTGALPSDTCSFTDHFIPDDLCPSVDIRFAAAIASHDELGVAAYRIEIGGAKPAALGFATDLGRMRDHLIEHLQRVDVLAIESNYCIDLQEASDRPWYLKRRITGGHGHLSNAEALEAVRRIEPRTDVVLLHLSRECNDPALVAQLHDGAPYRCTITSQTAPTPWIHITPGPGAVRCSQELPQLQLPLFSQAPAIAPPPVVVRSTPASNVPASIPAGRS